MLLLHCFFIFSFFFNVLIFFSFKNLLIEALFPEKYFRILHHTKNGSYFHVSPLQKGVTKIEGVLKGLLVKVGFSLYTTIILLPLSPLLFERPLFLSRSEFPLLVPFNFHPRSTSLLPCSSPHPLQLTNQHPT